MGESQNGYYKKTKNAKFLEKRKKCVSGGKKCSFFGKFGVLCFLVTPVLRFALLSYDCRFSEIAVLQAHSFNRILICVLNALIFFRVDFSPTSVSPAGS